MGSNSDDGEPGPGVTGGFLQRWDGKRACWYESGGGKLVVVEVAGGAGFEGRREFRLVQRSTFFACGSRKRPNGEDKLSRETKVAGIEKGNRGY